MNNFCKYCHEEANFVIKSGAYCCKPSPNQCPFNKNKNSIGLTKAHAEGKMRTDQLAIKRNWAKDKNVFNDDRIKSKISKDKIFSEDSDCTRSTLKKIIVQERFLNYSCIQCGNTGTWCDKKIVLELDHINGNSRDNRIENLRFLCPNCHSQTPTFRNKNTGNKRNTLVLDEDLLHSILNTTSIHVALKNVGMAGAANYKRAYSLLINSIKNGDCSFEQSPSLKKIMLNIDKPDKPRRLPKPKLENRKPRKNREPKFCKQCSSEMKQRNLNYCSVECSRKSHILDISDEKIIELYNEHKSVLKVQRLLDNVLSDNGIRKRLRKHGVRLLSNKERAMFCKVVGMKGLEPSRYF